MSKAKVVAGELHYISNSYAWRYTITSMSRFMKGIEDVRYHDPFDIGIDSVVLILPGIHTRSVLGKGGYDVLTPCGVVSRPMCKSSLREPARAQEWQEIHFARQNKGNYPREHPREHPRENESECELPSWTWLDPMGKR